MRVRAISQTSDERGAAGYYGEVLRMGGDEFELSDPRHFSKKWMEVVQAATPTKKAPAGKSARPAGGKPERLEGETLKAYRARCKSLAEQAAEEGMVAPPKAASTGDASVI